MYQTFNFKNVAVTSVWRKDEKIESFSSFFLKLKTILKMMSPRVKKYLLYFQFLTSFISSYPAFVIKQKKQRQTTATKTIIMFKLWASFGRKLIFL